MFNGHGLNQRCGRPVSSFCTNLDFCSVHVGPADVGGPVPLAVEHVSSVGVDHDGPRPLQVAQQRPPVVRVLRAEDVQRSFPEQVRVYTPVRVLYLSEVFLLDLPGVFLTGPFRSNSGLTYVESFWLDLP